MVSRLKWIPAKPLDQVCQAVTSAEQLQMEDHVFGERVELNLSEIVGSEIVGGEMGNARLLDPKHDASHVVGQ